MDTLTGGAGRDRLIGGAGNDLLTGGADSDIFRFNPNDGLDTITDFETGIDRLVLHSTMWTGTKTAAQIVADHGTIFEGQAGFMFNGTSIRLDGIADPLDIVNDIVIL
jgi:Ca2+-binding RTX toxin-like protein